MSESTTTPNQANQANQANGHTQEEEGRKRGRELTGNQIKVVQDVTRNTTNDELQANTLRLKLFLVKKLEKTMRKCRSAGGACDEKEVERRRRSVVDSIESYAQRRQKKEATSISEFNGRLRDAGVLFCEYVERHNNNRDALDNVILSSEVDPAARDAAVWQIIDAAAMERAERQHLRDESALIRSHHRFLREQSKLHGVKRAWSETASSGTGSERLRSYARAMKAIATKPFAQQGIMWTVERMVAHFAASPSVTPIQTLQGSQKAGDDSVCPRHRRRVKLLDIGSCFNPYRLVPRDHLQNIELDVVALDLCPAHESVFECDFLELQVGAAGSEAVVLPPRLPPPVASSASVPSVSCERLMQLAAGDFDVVTICLVLSYLPSPRQRAAMLRKAIRLLRRQSVSSLPPAIENTREQATAVPGLLLILTPHSVQRQRCPHTNQPMLQLWQKSIEQMGMRRIRHDELSAVYALAYETTDNNDNDRAVVESPQNADDEPLTIPIAHDYEAHDDPL